MFELSLPLIRVGSSNKICLVPVTKCTRNYGPCSLQPIKICDVILVEGMFGPGVKISTRIPVFYSFPDIGPSSKARLRV